SYAADLTRGQQWLEQVGRVHDTAGGRTGANDGMDFVDEQDRLGTFLQRLEQRLEALLEVPAVLGTGQQCAEIQRVHHSLGQYVGYLAIHDTLGQTFGNGCLADTGLTHQQRVVLAPAHQDLRHPLDLVGAPYQRVDAAETRLLVEVGGI